MTIRLDRSLLVCLVLCRSAGAPPVAASHQGTACHDCSDFADQEQAQDDVAAHGGPAQGVALRRTADGLACRRLRLIECRHEITRTLRCIRYLGSMALR